jgi:hypothetical protein
MSLGRSVSGQFPEVEGSAPVPAPGAPAPGLPGSGFGVASNVSTAGGVGGSSVGQAFAGSPSPASFAPDMTGGEGRSYGPPAFAPHAEVFEAGLNSYAKWSLIMLFLFFPLAIVFGHIALRRIAVTGERGRGLALAGLCAGYVFLALGSVLAFIVISTVIAMSHALIAIQG